MKKDVSKRSSIGDFSEQWVNFTRQNGYYASEEMLRDYLEPLLSLEDLKGKRICDIGSGNGRFLKIIAGYAEETTGIEPSESFHVLKEYVRECNNVEIIHHDLYSVGEIGPFDLVFCLGVLHHMTDPVRAVRKIYDITREGGQVVIWVYGREGNEYYLTLSKLLRKMTTRMSHRALKKFSRFLLYPLKLYIKLCRSTPLPMAEYMLSVLGRMDDYTLILAIYDQLNPHISEYWSRNQLLRIMDRGGFIDVKLHHRHGYSWTILATKQSRTRDG